MSPLSLGDDDSDSDGDLPETSSFTNDKNDTLSLEVNVMSDILAPKRPDKLRFIKDFLESELRIQSDLGVQIQTDESN